MAPRKDTVIKLVAKAIAHLEANRVAKALQILTKLDARMADQGGPSKPPNAYAQFVAKNFSQFQKEHPNKNATEIMPLIAAAWKKQRSPK